MKNLNTYTLLFLMVVLFACKKDKKQEVTNSRKYLVSFGLDGFKQQILGSNSSRLNTNGVVSDTGSIKAMFDSIGYVVYESGGKLIHSRSFSTKTFTNSITDSLSSGSYKIAFYAAQAGLITNLTRGLISYPSNAWKDTYAKTLSITVSNNNLNQTITLQRILADVQFDIKDPIPANATRFTLGLYGEWANYSIFYDAPFEPASFAPRIINIPPSAIGQTDFKFDYITLGTNNPASFSLICYGKGESVLAQQYFQKINVQKNQQTILTGSFFGGAANNSGGFQSTVNQVWNPTPTVVTF